MKKYLKYFIITAVLVVIIGVLWYSRWEEMQIVRDSWYSIDGYHYYDLPPGNTDVDPIIKHKGE